MTFKAYGTFIKKDGFIYHTDIYLQFGESENIIGACVLCNPGSSYFMDKNEEEKLVGHVGESKYEKNKWLTFINSNNIIHIGVEGKKPPHYYHPLPRINEKREWYREAINKQFNDLLEVESSHA